MVNIAFIYSFSYFKQLIGGQGEDSCGNSGTGETPQERKRRGGSPAARGKRSLARKSMAASRAVQLLYPICMYLDRIIRGIPTSFLLCVPIS
ncbi:MULTISPECIES: hypothetical protein [Priestia]|uniref:hypothetical protein n=1 Tax=Priestia TaxID=2800373 RepID=UPI001E5A53AF|nr:MULTISPECIES: hypothetical protein [Priestia]MCM3794507.1 hypothetical protein [Priestia megaterium]